MILGGSCQYTLRNCFVGTTVLRDTVILKCMKLLVFLKWIIVHTAETLKKLFVSRWIQDRNTSLPSLWWNSSTLLIGYPEHLPSFPFSQIEWRKASERTKDKSKLLRLSLFQQPGPHCLELAFHWSATISFPFILQIKPRFKNPSILTLSSDLFMFTDAHVLCYS